MSTDREKTTDAILASTLEEHPAPTSYTHLDASSQSHIEERAAAEGITPEAFYSRGVARRKLDHSQRWRARVADAAREQDRHAAISSDIGDIRAFLGEGE